jgi:hypothetical protein
VSYFDINPLPALLEESRRELERERERKRQIREALAARHVERPSRLSIVTARLRHAFQRDPCRPLVEGC